MVHVEMFCDSFDDARSPLEIVEWHRNCRLTKRIYDIVMLSMRAEYPYKCFSKIYVDGVFVGSIHMRYRRLADGQRVRITSTYSLKNGIYNKNSTRRTTRIITLGDCP